MEAYGRQIKRMVVNLEILEARNVIAKPAGFRGSLFVRYYLSTGHNEGNHNIAVNTKEVLATRDPQWKQTFCLECAGSIDDVNVISRLKKEFVRFELRERSTGIRVLGSMFRASKVVGLVEIAWKDLLESPTLSINNWFPLISSNSGGSQLAPSLHLAISIKPLSSVDSVSQPAQEQYGTEKETYDPEFKKSCRNEIRRNYVNRRIRRLERDDCRCGGKVCCHGLYEEGIFAGVA